MTGQMAQEPRIVDVTPTPTVAVATGVLTFAVATPLEVPTPTVAPPTGVLAPTVATALGVPTPVVLRTTNTLNSGPVGVGAGHPIGAATLSPFIGSDSAAPLYTPVKTGGAGVGAVRQMYSSKPRRLMSRRSSRRVCLKSSSVRC